MAITVDDDTGPHQKPMKFELTADCLSLLPIRYAVTSSGFIVVVVAVAIVGEIYILFY